jgi:hypothetical protein
MSTKHTPGPWMVQTSNSVRRIGNAYGDGNVCFATKHSDGCADLVFPNGGFNGPDARLIAAAPELLDALVRMEAYVSNNLSSEGGTGIDIGGAQFQAAWTAIAKATGSAA